MHPIDAEAGAMSSFSKKKLVDRDDAVAAALDTSFTASLRINVGGVPVTVAVIVNGQLSSLVSGDRWTSPGSRPRERGGRRRCAAREGTRQSQEQAEQRDLCARKYPMETEIQWKPGNSILDRWIKNVCFGSVSNLYHEFYK
jgi:hypothetical protein